MAQSFYRFSRISKTDKTQFVFIFVFVSFKSLLQGNFIIGTTVIINRSTMIKLLAFRILFKPLVLAGSCRFSEKRRPYYSESNNIFKDYYSRRLTVEPRELQTFLIRLSQHTFNESDHRWISLVQNIEERLDKFNNYSRVYMLKALINIGSKINLFDKLYELLEKDIGRLTFEETGVLLWCLSKSKKSSSNSFEVVQQLYQHMLTLCLEGNSVQPVAGSHQQTLVDPPSRMVMSPMVLSMIFGAMASLKITDKHLLKLLIRDGVRANLSTLSPTALTTFLISFEKLGLRNKRDTLLVYNQLRNQLKQLEMQSLQTLQNLAYCVANLCLREYSQEQLKRIKERDGQQQKQDQMRGDMSKFLLWICQTLLLREQNLKKETAAKILFYCNKAEAFHPEIWTKAANILVQKIEDCKIIDLVMAMKAISGLNKDERNLLSSQEDAISKRLWLMESSIAGKSLDILVHLFKSKRIQPPPKIAKQFNNLIMEEESNRMKARRENPTGSNNKANQQRRGSHIL